VCKKIKNRENKKTDQNFKKVDRFGFISLKPKKPNRTKPKQKKPSQPEKNRAKPKKSSQTGLEWFLS